MKDEGGPLTKPKANRGGASETARGGEHVDLGLDGGGRGEAIGPPAKGEGGGRDEQVGGEEGNGAGGEAGGVEGGGGVLSEEGEDQNLRHEREWASLTPLSLHPHLALRHHLLPLKPLPPLPAASLSILVWKKKGVNHSTQNLFPHLRVA